MLLERRFAMLIRIYQYILLITGTEAYFDSHQVKSPLECARKAAKNKKAKFWTYFPGDRCFLKTSKEDATEDMSPVSGKVAVSGNVECGGMSPCAVGDQKSGKILGDLQIW